VCTGAEGQFESVAGSDVGMLAVVYFGDAEDFWRAIMKTAIIGWGSLVWNLKGLGIVGDWINQGPKLKIEFSRLSKDGRLTLVIDPNDGVEVSTYFSRSIRTDLGDVIADLRDREGTVRKRIGFVDVKNGESSKSEFSDHVDVFDNIGKWCEFHSFDAAVWTALPPQFKEQTNRDFNVENAIAYLRGLPLSARKNALEYIRKAPNEVMTPLRQKVEQLGLT
jgi:hypothetical protein